MFLALRFAVLFKIIIAIFLLYIFGKLINGFACLFDDYIFLCYNDGEYYRREYMLEVYDINFQKIKCEPLFTFEKNDKNFIVYKDNEEDILASYYRKEGNKLIIMPITEDEDYDLVDIELEKWWNDGE